MSALLVDSVEVKINRIDWKREKNTVIGEAQIRWFEWVGPLFVDWPKLCTCQFIYGGGSIYLNFYVVENFFLKCGKKTMVEVERQGLETCNEKKWDVMYVELQEV